MLDKDINKMHNRIRLLQLEEEKALKKIEEMRKKAKDMIEAKMENERKQAKKKAKQEKEFKKKQDAVKEKREAMNREAAEKAMFYKEQKLALVD
jgi:hypothetical protein